MKIALISCVKTKLNKRANAHELYISPLFKFNYAYAKQTCDKVFILSAKYGLIEENEIIEPYEKTLNKMKKLDRQEWSTRVLKSLKLVSDIEHDDFVFLAGQKYREFIIPHIENYQIPMKNLSFGKQLQKLKELLK